MTIESPDWSRLPHDPIAFFKLADGFSRRDLKKSYHGLIRQYKPERAPEEFQRIRAAYEVLDGQLRYGRQDEPVAANSFDWSSLASTVPDVPSVQEVSGMPATPDVPSVPDVSVPDATVEQTAPSPQPAPSLTDRLKTTSAKQLYAELSGQKEKSPRDYYALAVLSDLVERQKKQMFLRWLLTGLQQHRQDPGLMALLRELLRTEPPADLSAKTLVAISKIVNSDQFYYTTEPIWDRLVTSMPFAQLEKTLVACERNLRDLRVHGKVAFYIHLVRRVMWKAPLAWVESTIRFLNEHHDIIEQGFDYDMEFVEAIFACRRASESPGTQAAESELKKMIHEAIVRFCESDEIKGDRIVIGCQTRLANDSAAILAAFACESEEADPLLVAWEFVSDDVAARQSEPQPADHEEMAKLAFHCLRDCARADAGRSWWFVFYGPFLLNVLVAGVVLAVTMAVLDASAVWISFVAAGAAGLAFYPVAKKLRNRLIFAAIRRQYRRMWRERVVRFTAATQLPFRHMLALLHEAAEFHEDEFHAGTWVVQLAAGDPGLAVYATARQFLR